MEQFRALHSKLCALQELFSFVSALLLHLFVASWFQLHQLLFRGVAQGTEGSISSPWPCEQNRAILGGILTLLGEVVVVTWNAGGFLGGNALQLQPSEQN